MRFSTGPEYRQVRVDVLPQDYPLDHELIIYRVATLPIQRPSIRHVLLRDLPGAEIPGQDTVVVPPGSRLRRNHPVRSRLQQLDSAWAQESPTHTSK